jgi:hypothetical protein
MTRPPKRKSPERYRDVSILFLTAGEDAVGVRAQVIEREDEMVISIPDQESSPPYLVRGNRVEHFFAGVDSLDHEERANVVARWTKLGDVRVGIWIEEGTEYLFSLRVPRRSSVRSE